LLEGALPGERRVRLRDAGELLLVGGEPGGDVGDHRVTKVAPLRCRSARGRRRPRRQRRDAVGVVEPDRSGASSGSSPAPAPRSAGVQPLHHLLGEHRPGTASTAEVVGWKTCTGSETGLRIVSGATPRASAPARREITRTRFTGCSAIARQLLGDRGRRGAPAAAPASTSSHSACGISPASMRGRERAPVADVLGQLGAGDHLPEDLAPARRVERLAGLGEDLGALAEHQPHRLLQRHLARVAQHRAHHLAVRRLDEAEVVDPRVGGQRVDQPDVRTFRRLDRAHAPVVRVVHVAHLEARALARQTARPQRRETPLVRQLGQRVRLVHELAELRRPEELLDHRRDRARVDQVVDVDLVRVGHDRHPLADQPRHAREADRELVGDQLAHRAHPAVAEVVDVVRVAAPLVQLHQVVRIASTSCAVSAVIPAGGVVKPSASKAGCSRWLIL
jgi:hypothetical protein